MRLLALLVACAATPLLGADFAVSPIRLDIERGTRSALVTVTNDDMRPLRMQLRLAEWRQDAEGRDVFQDSEDLIYFPKLMTIEPKDQRLVRVGLKAPVGPAERTYRLFLDELPDASAPATGSAVTFSIRFALPIFLVPADPKPRGEIAALALERGKLAVKVENTGNQHFRIEAVRASGTGGFSAELTGWYLLAGASRVYTIDVPPAACRGLRRIEVTIKADKVLLQRALEVEPSGCAA